MVINRYILITNILIAIIISTCDNKRINDGCQKGKENYKQDEFSIIMTKKPYKKWYNYFEGKSLQTGLDTVFKSEGRWYEKFNDYVEIGDTVIKSKGELFIEIHTIDTVYISEWTCNGVLINGISIKDR